MWIQRRLLGLFGLNRGGGGETCQRRPSARAGLRVVGGRGRERRRRKRRKKRQRKRKRKNRAETKKARVKVKQKQVNLDGKDVVPVAKD